MRSGGAVGQWGRSEVGHGAVQHLGRKVAAKSYSKRNPASGGREKNKQRKTKKEKGLIPVSGKTNGHVWSHKQLEEQSVDAVISQGDQTWKTGSGWSPNFTVS